jgi:hypothetical protein
MQRLLEVAKYMYAAWSPKRPRHIEHKSPSVMSIVFHTQHLLHENSRELQMIILILLSLERISAAARGGSCCAVPKPRLCSRSVWLMETPAYAWPCIPMFMSYWRRGRIHMRLKVVRPKVERITRIRVPPKLAAEVLPTFWLHPHPRALPSVKQLPLLINLYGWTSQIEMFLI